MPKNDFSELGLGEQPFKVAQSRVIIPGGSSACLQLFDAAMNSINSWSFQVGWRPSLLDATIEYSNEFASDLIVSTRLRLSTGVISRRNTSPWVTTGSDSSVWKTTKVNWLETNTSFQTMKLASLQMHIPLSSGPLCWNRKTRQMCFQLWYSWAGNIGSPRIRGLIEHLNNSDSEWVSQAALQAAKN